MACSTVDIYRTYGVGKVKVKVILEQTIKPRGGVGA
jgi:hypothetical protein